MRQDVSGLGHEVAQLRTLVCFSGGYRIVSGRGCDSAVGCGLNKKVKGVV